MDQSEIQQFKALVAFGKVGVQVIAFRLLSFIALAGFLGLCGYVAYSPTPIGAVVSGIALLAFCAALKAEARAKPPEG